MEEESDLSTCRNCEKIQIRKFDGYYPDGRNKRFLDGDGRLWSGRCCGTCQKNRVKDQIKQKRQRAKSANSGTNV